IRNQAEGFDVEVREREDLAIIAVQGPQARAHVIGLLQESDRARADALARFSAIDVTAASGAQLFLARTGYTGEDGFEVVLPQEHAVALWDALLASGVRPAGLGARDT